MPLMMSADRDGEVDIGRTRFAVVSVVVVVLIWVGSRGWISDGQDPGAGGEEESSSRRGAAKSVVTDAAGVGVAVEVEGES